MDLTPKWAKPAAILGLELALAQAIHDEAVSVPQAHEFRQRIDELKAL